jgi:hypothetical protein
MSGKKKKSRKYKNKFVDMGRNLQLLRDRPFGFLRNLVVVVPTTQSCTGKKSVTNDFRGCRANKGIALGTNIGSHTSFHQDLYIPSS